MHPRKRWSGVAVVWPVVAIEPSDKNRFSLPRENGGLFFIWRDFVFCIPPARFLNHANKWSIIGFYYAAMRCEWETETIHTSIKGGNGWMGVFVCAFVFVKSFTFPINRQTIWRLRAGNAGWLWFQMWNINTPVFAEGSARWCSCSLCCNQHMIANVPWPERWKRFCALSRSQRTIRKQKNLNSFHTALNTIKDEREKCGKIWEQQIMPTLFILLLPHWSVRGAWLQFPAQYSEAKQ